MQCERLFSRRDVQRLHSRLSTAIAILPMFADVWSEAEKSRHREEAIALGEGGKHRSAKKKTMQNYLHALITRKETFQLGSKKKKWQKTTIE